jgi:hypothetical protein
MEEPPRTHFHILAKSIPVFTVLGAAGFIFGFSYSLILNASLGLPLWNSPLMFLISIAGFYVLTWITKIIREKENIVYYHHMVLFFLLLGFFLHFTGQNLHKGLDVSGLAFGLFTVFGRIGCFRVGCCHGIPFKRGVRYPESHRNSGFPRYLIGIPLIPVQLLESAIAGLAVLAGTMVVFVSSIPGIGISIFLFSYFFARFFLEFIRGDTARPYWLGFSEAQWTSVILCLLAGLAGYCGLLPWTEPFFLLAGIFLLLMTLIGLSYSGYPRTYRILGDPRKVKELISLAEASFAANVLPADGRFPLETKATRYSSWGLNVSADRIVKGKKIYTLYSFSDPDSAIDLRTCEKIAIILHNVNHREQRWEIIEGKAGVYHLLFQVA